MLEVGAVLSSPVGPFILSCSQWLVVWGGFRCRLVRGGRVCLRGSSNAGHPTRPAAQSAASPSPPRQAQSDAEALAGALDKDEGRASPCTPSTPSVCSPPSAASSVSSAGKNICSSCGLEILDRYLLKVRQGRVVACVLAGCGL